MDGRLSSLEPDTTDFVLLPEYTNTPGLEDRREIRHFARGPGAEFLQRVASHAGRLKSRIALAALVETPSGWVNRGLVFDAGGKEDCCYDKIHLTDVELDALGITAGTRPSVFECDGIRLAFAICFDVYFPEYFSALARQKVDLVLCPSYQRSETAERIRLTCRCRALDTGTYLIRSSYAVGRSDVAGRSLVASPEGDLMADAGSQPGVIKTEIDPARKFVKPASHGQPDVEHGELIDRHRKPECYGKL
jgi:predicted amidohydrolase